MTCIYQHGCNLITRNHTKKNHIYIYTKLELCVYSLNDEETDLVWTENLTIKMGLKQRY